MLGLETLHQCDGLAQDRYVAFYYSVNIVLHRKGGTGYASALEVGVYRPGAYHSAVYGQSFILVTVLGMFHCGELS